MRIAFFIGSMSRGGAERVISILANEYVSKGWDVDILTLLSNKVEYELHPKIKVISLVGTSENYLKSVLPWLVRIRKYILKYTPDRVVSFVGRINALVLTATIGLKIPIIVSERNDPKHDGRGKAMLWYCNKIYRRASSIVFQNKYEQSCFDIELQYKSFIVPNPVHVPAIMHCRNNEIIVATAGRLNPQKNHYMLIDAMEIVHKTHPAVKCRIYGEGNLRESLQKHINDKALANIVTLEGNRSDIHEKLAECRIFVLTSEFEGVSNALIEAMMLGLPCISTDYPGSNEIITSDVNGKLVKRHDHIELANTINRWIEEDNSLLSQIRNQAQKDAEKYKKENVLSLWHNVIDGLQNNQLN